MNECSREKKRREPARMSERVNVRANRSAKEIVSEILPEMMLNGRVKKNNANSYSLQPPICNPIYSRWKIGFDSMNRIR